MVVPDSTSPEENPDEAASVKILRPLLTCLFPLFGEGNAKVSALILILSSIYFPISFNNANCPNRNAFFIFISPSSRFRLATAVLISDVITSPNFSMFIGSDNICPPIAFILSSSLIPLEKLTPPLPTMSISNSLPFTLNKISASLLYTISVLPSPTANDGELKEKKLYNANDDTFAIVGSALIFFNRFR